MRAYQARLCLADDSSFSEFAWLSGRATRALFAQRRSGRAISKPRFMREFGLTSRQYNAVKFSLDGMESSKEELRPLRIADLREHIKAVGKKLEPKHTKKSRPLSPHNVRQLKRRKATSLCTFLYDQAQPERRLARVRSNDVQSA
ncbi:MAG: hypothetical protein ACLPYS_02470 [Vulcanimicrobiaceae bacterium]